MNRGTAKSGKLSMPGAMRCTTMVSGTTGYTNKYTSALPAKAKAMGTSSTKRMPKNKNISRIDKSIGRTLVAECD